MTSRGCARLCATALILFTLLLPASAEARAQKLLSTSAAVGLTIDSRGRLLYGEKTRGEIVRVEGGKKHVLARLAVSSNIEPGLLGIATNKKGYVWASYTTSQAGCPDPTRGSSSILVNAICVWRFKPSGSRLKPDKLIVSTGHPTGWRTHFGGGLHLGPDGALYLGVGDLGDNDSPSIGPNRSQDLTEPFGKILRIDPNRTNRAAAGNPTTCGDAANGRQRRIVDRRIYACGFRNPYSFDWDLAGRLWVADVGDKCDEINVVKPGVNFGWQPPRTDCAGTGAGSPILRLDQSATPSGVAIPKSPAAGASRGDVFFGIFRDSLIKRYDIRAKKLSTLPGANGRAGWSLVAADQYLYMSNGEMISRLTLR
ncbi:MAG: PQQ-dependent sugar dehydrogenase [Thermoleophilaceae bacterium]|nr:PQQ-dependent sugar dehydrogenase [Thermoleophilaceae bacterium]